jgi:hypothetical protein
MSRRPLRIKDYQPIRMRVFNTYVRALNALNKKKRLKFDEDHLIQTAQQQLGLHDFGDESFRENMRLWLKTIERQNLHPAGKLSAYKKALYVLHSRLGAQAWFSKYPEILERDIAAPIIIMGFARSGTTRLHRVLASDPRLVHLKGWEAVYPVPWKKSAEAKKNGMPDPRISKADAILRILNQHFGKIHPVNAMEPEEGNTLLMQGFLPMFSFLDENGRPIRDKSEVDAYEDFKRLLKLISWWRGDDPSKPWVLKTPVHMRHIDSLMQVFPNAKLIYIHRDPIKVVSSMSSLLWHYSAHETDHLEPQRCAQIVVGEMNYLYQKMIKVRETLIPKDQQLDILYADMNRDLHQVMAKIYDFIGLEYSEEVRQLQSKWMESKNKNWRGQEHRLEDFGTDAKAVDEALLHYRERFNIPYEGKQPQ